MTSTMQSKANISSTLFNTYLSVNFELKKHLRRKRLLIVAALAILVPLLFYISVPETVGRFATTSLGFLNILIIISCAMFAGDAICGEFENKTALLSFPTPQKRISIFAGKYISALLATFAVVALYYLVTIIQISHLYGTSEIPADMGKSFGLALIYATSAVSVVFLFSSILKRSISATILGFVSLFMILPIISAITLSQDVEPWFIVTYSANLITTVLGVETFAHGPGSMGIASDPDLATGIAVMLAYTVIGFAAGLVIANRKSVE